MICTQNYLEQITEVKTAIDNADALLLGAGAGLSASAGLTYSGERFFKHFADFHAKYGITDMYSGGFYPYETAEEYWAWWSRQIYINRYNEIAGKPYSDLFELVKDKEYFVLTTNVDHQFQFAGFDKRRLFYTQGDYGLFQCSVPCHDKTYDNEQLVRRMVAEQKDMKIPSALIPHCPVCGKPMTMNLRCDDKFVQDSGWDKANSAYDRFLRKYANKKIVFLELGVGGNTPVIIKYPFWKMTMQNKNATYVCINKGEAVCPSQIQTRSVCINKDIGKVIQELLV